MTIDRRYSVAEGTAFKAPCLVATTANITLGGLQSIDGVTVAEHDRVLVKDQTDQTLNGIYEASTGNWRRTKDFDGAYDIVKGTKVFVSSGAHDRIEYTVTSPDPIVIGTSAITFTAAGDSILEQAQAAADLATAAAASLGNQAAQYDTRAQAIEALTPVGVQTVKVVRRADGHPLSNATYVPGTVLGPDAFQDAGGRWWQLDISGPAIDSAWFGVSGDGSNQTDELQAAVDAVPTPSGALLVRGDILITALNLRGRYMIRFIGTGGFGAGADQQTTLHTAVGAGVARVIDARETIGISFEHMKIASTNPAHDGYLIDFGQSTLSSFSQTMTLDHCVILYNGTRAAINLYGALVGTYEKCDFTGSGSAVAFQNDVRDDELIFSNVHDFISCDFTPSGTAIPVIFSGEKISFDGCNVQASSTDGQGRFWTTSTVVPFLAASINDCSFYDVTSGGSVWGSFYAGDGLNITGNLVGGINAEIGTNYGFAIGGHLDGVKGFVVLGNTVRFMTAFIDFGGTPGAGNHARKGVVGGNSIYGTTTALYINSSNAEFVNLPNYIAVGGKGSQFFIQGMPTSVVGLGFGDWYNNSGVVTVA